MPVEWTLTAPDGSRSRLEPGLVPVLAAGNQTTTGFQLGSAGMAPGAWILSAEVNLDAGLLESR